MKSFGELRVVVLAGGPGSERSVSLVSGKAVLEGIQGLCRSVEMLDVKDASFDLPAGTDLVFNIIHGTFGEDGVLQEILETRGVPYTGAGRVSSQLAFDKIQSKERFVAAGVKTPAYEVVPARPGTCDAWQVPCVVKPPKEGSSVGVHLVEQRDRLDAALQDVAKYGPEALVEEMIRGKELTVGILGDEALPVIHIQPRSGFYDINNKYPWMNATGGTDYFCPADLPREVTLAVQAEALKAHRSLGVEIYSRVDVLLNAQNEPFVLEVNTIPGMTPSSLLPKAAAAVGVPFPELCRRIGEASWQLRGN